MGRRSDFNLDGDYGCGYNAPAQRRPRPPAPPRPARPPPRRLHLQEQRQLLHLRRRQRLLCRHPEKRPLRLKARLLYRRRLRSLLRLPLRRRRPPTAAQATATAPAANSRAYGCVATPEPLHLLPPRRPSHPLLRRPRSRRQRQLRPPRRNLWQWRWGPGLGQQGADFTLTSVDGEEINLYGLRGSPVILYYFATW